MRRLKERADKLDLVTPKRRLRNGQSGGKPFSRGHLYWLLSNPVYVGDVHHQGKNWPGQHEALIDRELWDRVQKTLSDQANTQTRTGRKSLLTGILFDETGDRLSPSHAVKGGHRYRYYVSHRLMDARRRDDTGWRLPAEELEKAVLAAVTDLLGDERWLAKTIGLSSNDPISIRRALDRAAELRESDVKKLTGKRDLICSIVMKIVVAPQRLLITISHAGLCEALGITTQVSPESADTVVDLPFALRRRGVEARLVIAGKKRPTIDTKLVETVAKAHEWMARLLSGRHISVADLSREFGLDDGEISRVFPLAFLAPDIIEAILNGRQPVDLIARRLKRLKPLPLSWADQRRALGFVAHP